MGSISAAGRGLLVILIACLVASCDPAVDFSSPTWFDAGGADYLIQIQRADGGDIGIGVAAPKAKGSGLEFSREATVAVAALVDPLRDESQPPDDPFGGYLVVQGRNALPYGAIWFRTRRDRIELDLGSVARAVLEATADDPGDDGTNGLVSVCSQTGLGKISSASADVVMGTDDSCAVWRGDLASVAPHTTVTIDMGRQWLTLLPLLLLVIAALATMWTLVGRGLGRPVARARWFLVACLIVLVVQFWLGYRHDESRFYSSEAGQQFTTQWTLWRFTLAMIGFGLVALLLPRVRERNEPDDG